jgi:hypothetical protein
MPESLMSGGNKLFYSEQPCCDMSYHDLSFAEFITQYESLMPKIMLFEQTLPWLNATKAFMTCADEQVIVHCLFEESEGQQSRLLIAWPLVHKSSPIKNIASLTSFYSSVAEPIFFTETSKQHLQLLFTYITQRHPWKTMLLGCFTESKMAEGNAAEGNVIDVITQYSPYQEIFSKTDNIYQQDICDYASYYQQRPSQLKNTIKRREKKLAKSHPYRTEVVTKLDLFPQAFSAYKDIYQQSWKGDEYSFDFIEKVCLAALAENKLRLGILYVNEEPAAVQLWFLQTAYDNDMVGQTTASIFKLAYIPKYQEFSVGSILSLVLSKHVIDQDKVTSIEFGMGSESYKKDWLSENRIRKSYLIYNADGFYGKLRILGKLLIPRLAKKIINCCKGKDGKDKDK